MSVSGRLLLPQKPKVSSACIPRALSVLPGAAQRYLLGVAFSSSAGSSRLCYDACHYARILWITRNGISRRQICMRIISVFSDSFIREMSMSRFLLMSHVVIVHTFIEPIVAGGSAISALAEVRRRNALGTSVRRPCCQEQCGEGG